MATAESRARKLIRLSRVRTLANFGRARTSSYSSSTAAEIRMVSWLTAKRSALSGMDPERRAALTNVFVSNTTFGIVGRQFGLNVGISQT